MRARATVAALLTGKQKQQEQLLFAFIQMPALQRVRWVVFGPYLQDWRGNVVLAAIAAGAVWLALQ